MTRPVPEWIGKDDSQRAPARVRLRIFDNANGKCRLCSLSIQVGQKWDLDHVQALIAGGENREANLRPAHVACHKAKTAIDVAEKAKVAAVRKGHLRIVDEAPKLQGRPFASTRTREARKQRAASKLPIPARSRALFATTWRPSNSSEARDGITD